MAPLELALDIQPRARVDVLDARALAASVHGDVLDRFTRCLYVSPHTTAGYLPESLAHRLVVRRAGLEPYLGVFQTVFPANAGYQHDNLELRTELAPEQRRVEPTNGDSHLAFMAAGLDACVSYRTRGSHPVYFVDLDGWFAGTPRRRVTRLVGYDREVEVARTSIRVPVSRHPIEAVNLKDPSLGLTEQIGEIIARHGVHKGRVRLALASAERDASLTINEYETLLMQHDLAEVLRNPLKFAAEKAKHAWNDPRAVPGKAIDYAKYDLVRAANRLIDALGLSASRLEHIVARALEVPAARLMRKKRAVNLLVSDSATPGRGALVEGTFQAPILVQWRAAGGNVRTLDIVLTRFL
ncbi:MAG: hypothetical protein IT184_13770 [Acidobacteria bacterium]|nr:hypothetical protein [Acidobacteriota bacterium]